ncbi:hypothetical protein P280DRAFT_505356 [Massarina eburnea CBS 473.64]|uniref:Uncharacterized protein n=1 Tax=Massarina eburnea CBS 473.64 TaxID=1395130 RepID=A0A6A6S5Y9_9PLEO|nr:hypothetical protein P280DRAFT_505356 [Massarina eburnea CBS 473.64]
MSEFEVLLQNYQLAPSLEADLGDDCVTIDVSPKEDSTFANSLEHMSDQVAKLLRKEENQPQSRSIDSAKKLYVFGTWSCAWPSNVTEWDQGVEQICNLIKEMKKLEELTWISELSFMGIVFDVLPTSLKKLIIDVGQPVKASPNGGALYIPSEGMKPLLKFTNLQELRVFGMRESFQAIIWETVFRNKFGGGMHVLDLRMASPPLVRKDSWIRAADVVGLIVTNEDPVDYKGIDGKGVLHHGHGTGEYLDDYCMRKARIASGLDESIPLPLWCLKLNGFVIDQLPFEHELSQVVMLTCGYDCVDAGLRAPKTKRKTSRNKWGASIDSEVTHCFIAWPNWSAIFDNEGQLLGPDGKVVVDSSDEADFSSVRVLTPGSSEPGSPHTPLTKKNLDNLQDSPISLYEGSNIAVRGSPVPSPRAQSECMKSLYSCSPNLANPVKDADAECEAMSNAAICGSTVATPSVILGGEEIFDIDHTPSEKMVKKRMEELTGKWEEVTISSCQPDIPLSP